MNGNNYNFVFLNGFYSIKKIQQHKKNTIIQDFVYCMYEYTMSGFILLKGKEIPIPKSCISEGNRQYCAKLIKKT